MLVLYNMLRAPSAPALVDWDLKGQISYSLTLRWELSIQMGHHYKGNGYLKDIV